MFLMKNIKKKKQAYLGPFCFEAVPKKIFKKILVNILNKKIKKFKVS